MKLATAHFKATDEISDSGLAPMAITVGRPRFKLPYKLAAYARDLAPEGWMLGLERAKFERLYTAKLDHQTPDLIRRRLDAARKGGPGLRAPVFRGPEQPRAVVPPQDLRRLLESSHRPGRP
jgi:hypothetical protein